MRLKEISFMVALATSSASGCKESEQPVSNKSSACETLQVQFRDRVGNWSGMNAPARCSMNLNTYLDVADIRKKLGSTCGDTVDQESYDFVLQGLRHNLSVTDCAANDKSVNDKQSVDANN